MVEGVFAKYQPEYAALGIATFPVRDKQPAVRNYMQMGMPASRSLVKKFGNEDGIGFACGKRSNITILDVDSTDERILAEALDRFGPTPFIVRSASGNHHAWYRHNGEKRQVRPNKSVPIDILGGGYVVAPPSRTSGGEYEIISGSLDDLVSLPCMRSVDEQAILPVEGASKKVTRGERNERLWRMCMRHAPHCDVVEDLMRFAGEANRYRFEEPLPDDEVVKIVHSAWKKEAAGLNFFNGRGGISFSHELFDLVAGAGPDALLLFSVIKRRHWGRECVLANGMAASMPPAGWGRHRLVAARNALLQLGVIKEVSPATPNSPAVYILTGVRNGHQ